MRSFLLNLLIFGIAGCSVIPFVGGENLPEPEKFAPSQENEDHQYASKQHAKLRSGLTGLSISEEMYENLNYGDAVRTDPVEIRGLDVELPPEDSMIANAERDILKQDEEQVKQEVQEQKVAESVEKAEQAKEEKIASTEQKDEPAPVVEKTEEVKPVEDVSEKVEETKTAETIQEKPVEQKTEVVAEVKEEPKEEKVGQNVVAIAPVEVNHEAGKENTSVVEGAFKEERSSQLKSADQIIEDKIKVEQAQLKKQEAEQKKKAIQAEKKARRKAVKRVAKTADEIDVDALLVDATDLNDDYVNQLVNDTMNTNNATEVDEFLKHSARSSQTIEDAVQYQKSVVKKQSKPVVKKVEKAQKLQKPQEKVKLKLKAPTQQNTIKLKPLKRKLRIKETTKADDDLDPIYID